VIVPEHDLVIAHLQTLEWPDHASRLDASQLPNRSEVENDRKIMGHLIKLILDARTGSDRVSTAG
jgi:hypothetical protein